MFEQCKCSNDRACKVQDGQQQGLPLGLKTDADAGMTGIDCNCVRMVWEFESNWCRSICATFGCV